MVGLRPIPIPPPPPTTITSEQQQPPADRHHHLGAMLQHQHVSNGGGGGVNKKKENDGGNGTSKGLIHLLEAFLYTSTLGDEEARKEYSKKKIRWRRKQQRQEEEEDEGEQQQEKEEEEEDPSRCLASFFSNLSRQSDRLPPDDRAVLQSLLVSLPLPPPTSSLPSPLASVILDKIQGKSRVTAQLAYDAQTGMEGRSITFLKNHRHQPQEEGGGGGTGLVFPSPGRYDMD